jgi:vitamin K-dependent gamma-carboxylase
VNVGCLNLARAWQRWLFSRGDLHALALFRMGWALAMSAVALHDWGRAAAYAPDRYHLPLVKWVAPLEFTEFHTLLRIGLAGCLLTLLGALPRLGAICVVATYGYLLSSDVLLFRNHVYLGCLLGLLLASSPCGSALSVDSWVRNLVGRPTTAIGSRVSVQLIKAQILLVYFWSVVNKLRPSFLDGWALQQELRHALGEGPIAPWLQGGRGTLGPVVTAWTESDRGMALCSWAVVLVEAFLFLGLPRRRWRRCAALAGVALHGSIFLLMGVITFGLLVVSSYPLFFELQRRPKKANQKHPDVSNGYVALKSADIPPRAIIEE